MFEFGFRIQPQVLDIIAELFGRPPGNLALGIYVSHCVTSNFELSEHFGKNTVAGRNIATSPEASLLVSLLDAFTEDFVH